MAVKKELIKKFAIDYATTNTRYSLTTWGSKYGVSSSAISKWLELPYVKTIIEEETVSFSEFVTEKARKNVGIAMRELKKIIKMPKMTDVKRRACVDMMEMAKGSKIKDSSKPSSPATKELSRMNNKKLEKEYDKLLGNTKRKAKTSPINQAPGDATIN